MTTGTEIVKTQIVVLVHNLLRNSDEAFPFRQRLLVDLGILKVGKHHFFLVTYQI